MDLDQKILSSNLSSIYLTRGYLFYRLLYFKWLLLSDGMNV